MNLSSIHSIVPLIALGVSLLLAPLLPAQTTVAEWRAKALEEYPALAQAGSEFNAAFIKLYQEKKENDPALLQQPDWPWVLATQVAQASGTPAATQEPAAPPLVAASEPSSPQGHEAPAPTPATPIANTPGDQSNEWSAKRIPDDLGLEHAQFAWWAPGGARPRGILVLAPGRGGDGRGMAKDAKWQAIARDHELGIVACFIKNRADTPFAYQQDPNGGTSKLVDEAVDALMKANGHSGKELPLFFYGHSAGANVSQNYGDVNPGRMIGAVLMRCPNGSGAYSPGKGNVPMLVYVGGKDKAEWVASSLKNYEVGKGKRALWTLAHHPEEGHGVGKTWALTDAFVRAVLEERIGKPGGEIRTKPKKLSRQHGWLGDEKTMEVGANDQFKGKKTDATWLPNEATALLWQSYLKGN